MAQRFLPVARGFYVTSPFGYQQWRGATHWGQDFGRDGGSGGHPVFAAQSGKVVMRGNASGFSSNTNDPWTGWVVIDHPTDAGGGTTVYGHIIAEVSVGDQVTAGQRIGRINPDRFTNGGVRPNGVDPHLHFEVHKYVWSPRGVDRLDPGPWLSGAVWPGEAPAPTPAPPAPARDIWRLIHEQLIGIFR